MTIHSSPGVRGGPPSEVEGRIRAALDDPAPHAGDLAEIFNDPGLRDAALVLCARDSGWQALSSAARAAGAWAAEHPGEHSVYGPLVALSAARWVMGDSLAVAAAARRVPAADASSRMAELLGRLAASGTDPQGWVERMGGIPVAQCLAFRRETTPGTPAPASAAQWFAAGTVSSGPPLDGLVVFVPGAAADPPTAGPVR